MILEIGEVKLILKALYEFTKNSECLVIKELESLVKDDLKNGDENLPVLIIKKV